MTERIVIANGNERNQRETYAYLQELFPGEQISEIVQFSAIPPVVIELSFELAKLYILLNGSRKILEPLTNKFFEKIGERAGDAAFDASARTFTGMKNWVDDKIFRNKQSHIRKLLETLDSESGEAKSMISLSYIMEDVEFVVPHSTPAIVYAPDLKLSDEYVEVRTTLWITLLPFAKKAYSENPDIRGKYVFMLPNADGFQLAFFDNESEEHRRIRFDFRGNKLSELEPTDSLNGLTLEEYKKDVVESFPPEERDRVLRVLEAHDEQVRKQSLRVDADSPPKDV